MPLLLPDLYDTTLTTIMIEYDRYIDYLVKASEPPADLIIRPLRREELLA